MNPNEIDLNRLLAPKTSEEIISQVVYDVKEIQQLLDKLEIKGVFI
jgi:hypothetical protein